MSDWLYYSFPLLSGLLLSFGLLWFKPVFFLFAETSVGILNQVLSSLPDDEKAKAIQKALLKWLRSFLLLILAFAVIAGLLVLPIYIYSFLFELEFQNTDTSTIYFYLALSLGSVLPFIFNRRKNEAYTDASKLLHRLALNHYNVSKKLFQTEQKRVKKESINQQFLIVSGLARSGTTSLLNHLSKQEKLCSLTYANMPFLLAPNLWRKVYSPKNKTLRERPHKDGINVGLNSPEALEEYFFKVILDDAFISREKLKKHKLSEKSYDNYLKYQAIVLNDASKTYLAKNNNFLLRYESMRKLNSAFKFVVMLREPVAHANSLLQQHKNFLQQQTKDSFVLEYMDWLGHHEFGLNQKWFDFDYMQEPNFEKLSLNYWLAVWLNYYGYLSTLNLDEITLVDYDAYCQSPEKVIHNILREISIDNQVENIAPYQPKRYTSKNVDAELLLRANEIYQNLKKRVEVTLP